MKNTYNLTKPLENVVDDLDEVRVSLYHTTGGINYYSYKNEKAGWYLSFSPVHVERSDAFESQRTILFHERAFKMFCNESKRFSAQRLEKLSKILDEHIDLIVELYDNKEDEMLYQLIQSKFMGVK